MNSEDRTGFEHSLMMPYLTGVYLAVNAIRDAYMVVDGPNCVFFRTAQIQANHDWHSTLASCTGLHRVADTDCTTERAAVGDQRLLMLRLKQVNAIEDCRLILLTAMSPAAVTGRQYDKMLRELKGNLNKPVVQVRFGSLTGDWLCGYVWTLEDLARQIELPPGTTLQENEVSIVGYLMDRNEADHTANLDDLKGLLEGLSLKLASCWLSGGVYEDLRAVSRSGTILSFPYGRQAARILAERTGARLLECSLPMGLAATSGWLRLIGEALGRKAEAEAVIERELSWVVPKLEWILPHSLLNKKVALLGNDPYLIDAISDAIVELGCLEVLRVCVAHRVRLEQEDNLEPDRGGQSIRMLNPSGEMVTQLLERLQRDGLVDLAITNSRMLSMLTPFTRTIPFLELGFPSYNAHALVDSPFLGYRGALKLVERIANTLSHASVSAFDYRV